VTLPLCSPSPRHSHGWQTHRVPMEIKAGDKVLYGKYSGTEVTIDGEQLLILRESDVLAVIS